MGGNDVTKTLFKLDLTYLNNSNYISDPRIRKELKRYKMIDTIDVGDLIIQNKHGYNPNTFPEIVIRHFILIIILM